MKKTYAVLAMPLWLSGCMMLGMGGMGMGGGAMKGTPGGMPASGQTLVKKSLANGIRMTVDLPPYRLGDNLEYTVTLQDELTKAAITDASMALLVSPVEGRAQDQTSGQAGAHAEHGTPPPAARGGTAVPLEFAPDGIIGGRYVFRPSITAPGAYRLRFALKRIGTLAPNPPHELEHVVQLDGSVEQHAGGGARSAGGGVTPLIVLGAVAMAVAMLFMFR